MKRSAGNYIVADLVENFDEAVAGARGAEEGSPAITAEDDEVEIAASIEALQTVAHESPGQYKVKVRTLERHKGCGTHAYICYLQRVVRE
jgi:hypothetical protein